MAKKYVVRLSADERTLLTDLVSAGKAAARAQTHARILLKADQGPDGPARIKLKHLYPVPQPAK